MNPTLLDRLFWQSGSDKGFGGHLYGEFYESKLKDLRNKPLKVLEIGLSNKPARNDGSISDTPSLWVWAVWFRNAQIIGADIRPFKAPMDRMKTYTLDQGKGADIMNLVEAEGPFDIVIDDGSHLSSDILTSLKNLMDHTNLYYFIEDLHITGNLDVIAYLDFIFGDCAESWWSACERGRFVACIEVERWKKQHTSTS